MDNTWNKVPDQATLDKTVMSLEERGFEVTVVENGQQALETLKTMIPEGAEVMTGSSTTLNEIDFMEYLKSEDSKHESLGAKVYAENDDEKRNDLRRLAVTADYYVSSINAISENGELVAVDATGSRVGAMPFAAKNLIIVAGANKIAKDLESAMQRVREYVFPQENDRAQQAYGSGSTFGKWVIIEKEVNRGRIKIVLVKEALGF